MAQKQGVLAKMAPYKMLYLLMLPIVIYFGIVVFWPLVKAVLISFQDFGIFGFRGWAGFDNYRNIFADEKFWQAAINTVMISLGITLIGFSFPIVVAIALADITGYVTKRFFQTIIYLPNLFSWVIIVGIWVKLFAPVGLINTLLLDLGWIQQAIPFFSTEVWVRPLLIAQTIWKDVGYHAVIYLAAIMTINPELYDAADVDGASVFSKIRYVTLPALVPTMKVVFLLTLLGSMKTFDVSYLMSNSIANNKIRTLAVYTYDRAFVGRPNLAEANASGVFLIIIAVLLSIIVHFILKKNKKEQQA